MTESLADLAGRIADLEERALEHRTHRDNAIRTLASQGTPQRELARITGLSRAQIQRICDLSGKGQS